MTRDEILALPAGRELDALVAERVMGWLVVVDDVNFRGVGAWRTNDDGKQWMGDLPAFSTDIAAAWQVVTRLTLRRYAFALNIWAEGGPVFAKFTEGYREHVAEAPFGCEALAICRAALLALEWKARQGDEGRQGEGE